MRPRLEALHPILQARDVAASAVFYQALGFAIVFQNSKEDPRYVGVERDGVQLHIQWADEQQWAYPIDRPAYRFMVSDVDAMFEEFVARDVVRLDAAEPNPWAAPKETPWGTREFHVRDPGGNVLQFYQPI